MAVKKMSEAVDHVSTSDTMTSTSIHRDIERDIPLDDLAIQEDKGADIGTSGELPEEEIKDVVPNGGYGWVNVGCIVLQNSVTWGMFCVAFSH